MRLFEFEDIAYLVLLYKRFYEEVSLENKKRGGRYLMEKKKVMLRAISIVAVVLVSTIVLIQVLMKRNVIEQVSQTQEKATPKALDVSSWDPSKVTVYTDKSGKVAPIPVGYIASNVTGETEIDTGLVIYEGTEPVIKPDSETGEVPETEIGVPGTDAWIASCNRNQWVWVPVDDVSRIYDKSTGKSKLYVINKTGRGKPTNGNREPAVCSYYDIESNFSKYNLPGMTKEKLLHEIDTELVETIKSIEKYGGFYIGRYETADVTDTRYKTICKKNANKYNKCNMV